MKTVEAVNKKARIGKLLKEKIKSKNINKDKENIENKEEVSKNIENKEEVSKNINKNSFNNDFDENIDIEFDQNINKNRFKDNYEINENIDINENMNNNLIDVTSIYSYFINKIQIYKSELLKNKNKKKLFYLKSKVSLILRENKNLKRQLKEKNEKSENELKETKSELESLKKDFEDLNYQMLKEFTEKVKLKKKIENLEIENKYYKDGDKYKTKKFWENN